MDIKSLIIGGAVGDALGLPVVNKTKMQLEQTPVFDILDGLFSDNTSMSWALADTILNGYDINLLMDNMLEWYKNGKYTATGVMVDVKQSVAKSIDRYIKNGKISGTKTETDNDSDALVRIAPMVLLTNGKNIEDRFELIKEVSSITHEHNISVLSCFFYTEFILELIKSHDKVKAYIVAQNKMKYLFANKKITRSTQYKFERVYPDKVWSLGEGELLNDGYVISSLETAMWCFMNTNNYEEAVLRAVNLGGDTATVASITGSVAGIFYGYKNIPTEWIESLVKIDELELLTDNLNNKF
jgi:ADP-ribosyl-[dinitrogen reductase] hydrolase